jgi:hypothetical protein
MIDYSYICENVIANTITIGIVVVILLHGGVEVTRVMHIGSTVTKYAFKF